MLLYKFRAISGSSFRFSQDIFVNRQLFLPTADSLNDPNEGVAVIEVQNQYRAWGNQLEERNRRSNVRVCALTEQHRSSVVWAHYADEHRGICLELDTDELDTTKGLLQPVQYSDSVPVLGHNSGTDPRTAFLNKTTEWAYEREWRYVSAEPSSVLPLSESTIRRVLLGARFPKSDLSCLEFWLSTYAPKRTVPVVPMNFASTEYSLYEESEMHDKVGRIG